MYTSLLGIWYSCFLIATIIMLDYTIFGIALLGLFALLHRVFRYFWTDFDAVDEQGEVIPGSAPAYERRRKRSKLMAWYMKYMGEKETEYKVTVSRYTKRQTMLAAVLGVVLLGLLVGSILLQLHIMRFNNNPHSGYLEYAGNEIHTFRQAYEAARKLARSHCKDAELIEYRLYYEPEESLHEGMYAVFIFRNPKANLLIHTTNELLGFAVYPDGDIIQRYDDNLTLARRFSPTLPKPLTDMDTDIMRDKALAAAGVDIGDMKSITMVPVLSGDASANIWNATVRTENRRINQSIDMAQ